MKLISELKNLRLPENQYAVFGSGPIAIRNMRESEDIDIIVKPGLWDELTKKYPLKKENMIKLGKIEIYKDWMPWIENVSNLIDDADIIRGIRFVKLKYVLKWKKKFNREKDRKDIPLILEYLRKHKNEQQ